MRLSHLRSLLRRLNLVAHEAVLGLWGCWHPVVVQVKLHRRLKVIRSMQVTEK